MNLYLSGPMSGKPDHNYPAFHAAAKLLRGQGHNVLNPAENFNGYTGFDKTTYMRQDIHDIVNMDDENSALVILEGWGTSEGAKLEVRVADAIGMPVFRLFEGELVEHGPWRPWGKDELPRGGDQRFHAVLDELSALHSKKAEDYGSNDDSLANVRASEGFGIKSWVGAMIRANDKIFRLKTYWAKGRLANESAEDSLLDLVAYTAIAIVLFDEQHPDAVKSESVTRHAEVDHKSVVADWIGHDWVFEAMNADLYMRSIQKMIREGRDSEIDREAIRFMLVEIATHATDALVAFREDAYGKDESAA